MPSSQNQQGSNTLSDKQYATFRDMGDGRTALAIVNPDGTAITAGAGGATSNATVGSPTTTTASQAGFKDNLGNVALGNLDATGNLKVAGTFTPGAVSDSTSLATLGALNASVALAIAGYYGVGFNIPSGLVGSIQAFVSYDGGTSYPKQVLFYDPSTSAYSATLTNPAGAYGITISGGVSHVKVIVSAYTSGAPVGTLRATYGTTPAIGSTNVANFPANQAVTVSNTIATTSSVANDNFAQALATTSGATATVINIASSVAGYQIKGMVCHGTGEGYFFIQINSVTVLSGRIRSTQPTLNINLPNGIAVTTASVVALKVTNESVSTADFEATLLGA